jgi:hypothetical protein
LLRKLLAAFFPRHKPKPEWIAGWENQRWRPVLEWTQSQWDTHRWLKAIEHDQRKRAKVEAGAICLHLEKHRPERIEELMRIFAFESSPADNKLCLVGTIVIDHDGEVIEGNQIVKLLVERRHGDPLRAPGPRSLY